MSDERPLTREERLLVGQVAVASWPDYRRSWLAETTPDSTALKSYRSMLWSGAEAVVRARPEHLDPSKAPADADLYVTEQEVAEAAEGIAVVPGGASFAPGWPVPVNRVLNLPMNQAAADPTFAAELRGLGINPFPERDLGSERDAAVEATIAGLTDPDPEAAMRRVANDYLKFDQRRSEAARACADAAAVWATAPSVRAACVGLEIAAHRWIEVAGYDEAKLRELAEKTP